MGEGRVRRDTSLPFLLARPSTWRRHYTQAAVEAKHFAAYAAHRQGSTSPYTQSAKETLYFASRSHVHWTDSSLIAAVPEPSTYSIIVTSEVSIASTIGLSSEQAISAHFPVWSFVDLSVDHLSFPAVAYPGAHSVHDRLLSRASPITDQHLDERQSTRAALDPLDRRLSC